MLGTPRTPSSWRASPAGRSAVVLLFDRSRRTRRVRHQQVASAARAYGPLGAICALTPGSSRRRLPRPLIPGSSRRRLPRASQLEYNSHGRCPVSSRGGGGEVRHLSGRWASDYHGSYSSALRRCAAAATARTRRPNAPSRPSHSQYPSLRGATACRRREVGTDSGLAGGGVLHRVVRPPSHALPMRMR